MTAREPDRRSILRAGAILGLAGVSVTVVSGCSGKSNPTQEGYAHLSDLSDEALQAVADAINSGRVAENKPAFLMNFGLIVTEPSRGKYKVFSNMCTHQAARVDHVNAKGNLVCPLHASEFDPQTGEAVVGPAGRPLPSKDATLTGGRVVVS